jgi:periplasmic protein CpxP/Spy
MKSMIKYLLAAAIAVAGFTTLANAADPADAATPATPRRQQGQNRIEQLTKELKLTDAQKTKLEAVFKAQAEKMRVLRQDQSLSREDRRAKMQKIQEESLPDIKNILTPEQFEQYKKIQEQRRQGGGRAPRPQQ